MFNNNNVNVEGLLTLARSVRVIEIELRQEKLNTDSSIKCIDVFIHIRHPQQLFQK